MEAELERRFGLRTELFEHSDFRVEIVVPASPEDLLDEVEFDSDERLPYWAELWPSARALARHLLDEPHLAGPAIELGCGVGLPSLALRHRGIETLATDYYPDALRFTRVNAGRNGIPEPTALLLDWRYPPQDLGTFPLVVAADVLYESRNVNPLADLLLRLGADGGCAILADPGRLHFPRFLNRLASEGWKAEELGTHVEPSPAGRGLTVSVDLVRLSPPIRSTLLL